MLIKFPDYQILDEISESNNSVVYRGFRKKDNRPVILKILKRKYPTATEIIKYKREYQITSSLNLNGVITAYDLIRYQNTLIIIFEDFGGTSLDILLKTHTFDVEKFLTIAIKITIILKNIHAANIIHKDINPSNIILNQKTEQLKIIDFGISTLLPQETLTLQNPSTLEGTLPYISPEQTGRMNRVLDYRSDFYSLGVTFYELLTKYKPFKCNDLLELIYSHIAKKPISPKKINPEVPHSLSEIILKLMAKNAEERYQSSWGIKIDLETCLNLLKDKKQILNFQLGQQDITDKFQLSQKLYGRQKEIKLLLKLIYQQKSPKEIILISGYSGIGKSALIREVYKPITKAKGYFISGKFDQYKLDRPFLAIVQAFQELVKYLLADNKTNLTRWKDKLIEAFKDNGQVIINLIPEIELIIGKQPQPLTLSSSIEERNRFYLIFVEFIKVFATKEHPLVVFLDDLQWADRESLQLIQLIMTNSSIEYLFFIGAYRNNEEREAYSLRLTIDKIQEAKVNISEIHLLPLNLSDVIQLIEDSFNATSEIAKPFAELILNKTKGNPFFINEFLRSLYRENFLFFNYKCYEWEWNLEKIKLKDITENVVELLLELIQQLDKEVQKILQLAACIGNQFKIETLAIISEKSLQETDLLVQKAFEVGLIFPLSDSNKTFELNSISKSEGLVEYKFVHDRVRQAAYTSISIENRTGIHRKIGNLLLQSTSKKELEENIFEITNHLNLGIKLFLSDKEKKELVNLNFIAGKKAKASRAYELAFTYFKKSIRLLNTNCWQDNYKLSLILYQEAAELAYVNGDFESMEKFSKEIELHTNLLEQVKIFELKIAAYQAQNKFLEALDIALSILKKLEINFPDYSQKDNIFIEFEKTRLAVQTRSSEMGGNIEDLKKLPKMENPYKLAAIRILHSGLAPACGVSPELLSLIIFKSIQLIAKYGNTPVCSHFYVGYGIMYITEIEDINYGYEFAKLALNLPKTFNNKELQIEVLFSFYGHIGYWKTHLNETLQYLQESHKLALDNGNTKLASQSLVHYLSYSYLAGKKLIELEKEFSTHNKNIWQFKQEQIHLEHINLWHQTVLNLLNKDDYSDNIKGDFFDETNMLLLHEKRGNLVGIAGIRFNKLIICYLYENYLLAYKESNWLEKNISIFKIYALYPVFFFYNSLLKVKLISLDPIKYKYLFNDINISQKKMKNWADNAPMNYQHKYDLVAAELYRLRKNKEKAADFYQKAIEGAYEYEYINEEALAYELAAKFYLEWNKFEIAQLYMQKALYKYQLWGAIAKVKYLKEKYSEIFPKETSSTTNSDIINVVSAKDTSSLKLENLDLAILIKTNQAISKEDNLEKLLALVLNFSLQAVGAQEGLIIFNESGTNLIKSEAKIEGKEIIIQSSNLISKTQKFPQSVVNYVRNTRKTVVEGNASSEGKFINDDYVVKNKAQSILCLPLMSQGKFVAVIYLENNLVANIFKEDDLRVLELITTQAAISIENTLLKSEQSNLVYKYQVGGCLTDNDPTYVVRQADRNLYEGLQQGNFCHILNARQQGKSSLCAKTISRLKADGYACGIIDLTGIANDNISLDDWYIGLIDVLITEFSLDDFDLADWLDSVEIFQTVQMFSKFLNEILLKRVSKKIVIFLDEIDNILSLNYCMDDFFGLIRSFYNSRRATQPNLMRLNFVITGVATPSSLINNKSRTPFNIGRSIIIEPFKSEDVQPLAKGLIAKHENPQILLEEILKWTGGQPFLTQKICTFVQKSTDSIPEGKESEWISDLVKTKIIDNWYFQDEPEHLKNIQTRILSSQSSREELLQLYQEVLLSNEIQDTDSLTHKELFLTGIVYKENGKLKMYNQIYREIFNHNWINNHSK